MGLYLSIIAGISGVVIGFTKRKTTIFWLTLIVFIYSTIYVGAINQNDQTKLQEAINLIKDKDDELLKLNTTIASSSESSLAILASQAAASGVSTTQQGTLKQRAIALSTEIFKFIGARETEMSSYESTSHDTPDGFLIQINAFEEETMTQYATQFNARVIEMRDELAKNGLKDLQLDEGYRDPTNSIGIRTVALRIEILARQLN